MKEKANMQKMGTTNKVLLAVGLVLGVVLIIVMASAPTRPASTTTGEQTSSTSTNFALVDKQAPDFTLLDQNDKAVSLSDYQGKNLIIFFSEGQMCYPSCWNQITSLGNNEKLNNDDVATLAVVTDTKDMWTKTFEENPEMLAQTMVYDFSKEVSAAYSVLDFPSSMHPGNLPGHTYVIIDSEGIVRHIKDDPQMGINDRWLEEKINELQGIN